MVELVHFQSDRFTIPAFLARPSAVPAEGAPGVLVLHEWWGLNDSIKERARRFAEAGFAALAPDLYARLGSTEISLREISQYATIDKIPRPRPGYFIVTDRPTEAAGLMSSLSSQAVLRDLLAATRFFKQQPGVDAQRIGLIGFSMGGTFALTQASHNSDLKAVVAFYGKVPPIETLRFQVCPIQYHYPAKDAWVTPDEVQRLSDGFARYGKTGQVHRYPDADHAFFNHARAEAYRAQDAALAWDRTLTFLRRYLQ